MKIDETHRGAESLADSDSSARPGRRQSRLPLPPRPLVLKIHRWLSLGALVWILMISLTGVVLVFGPQINSWSRPELFESTAGDKGPQAAVDSALAFFEGQDTAIDNISFPVDNRGVYVLNVSVTPARSAEDLASGEVVGALRTRSWLVFIDPGTGEVNGARQEASGFVHWCKRGHYILWQDSGFLWIAGDDLAGLVALSMLFITLTGFYIWYFPKVKHWSRNLRIRRKRGWFIFNLDLHRTLGLVVLLPLTVIAFTGAAFAFPDMKLLWERLTPAQLEYVQNEPEEDVVSEEIEDARALTTDGAWELLKKEFPGRTIENLEPPTESDGVWGAYLTKGYSPWQRDNSGGNTYLNIDRFSHKIVYQGTPEQGNVWDQVWEDWSLPLHGGDFLGNASRWAWFLVGLSPIILSGTGMVVWWQRRKRRPADGSRNGDQGLVPDPARRSFTSAEFERMTDAGIVQPDERLELLGGDVASRALTRPQHAECVDRLTKLFVTRAGDQVRVRVQGHIRLGDVSEATPDLSLVRPGQYAAQHPGAGDTLLVVEVSDSAGWDRRHKLPLYALAHVPEVWVVDPSAETVEVYADPQLSGWATKSRLSPGATISPLALNGTAFTVAELLGC